LERGEEEALNLKRGIKIEVIPRDNPSPFAVPEYAGNPVTP